MEKTHHPTVDSEKQLGDLSASLPFENDGISEVIGINASGHHQEVERNYGILSGISVGVTTGNAWTALGGTVVVALSNGGPPGVIYELMVTCIFYGFISASIAELASAMPSSGGVYHFASVCGGRKYGRLTGWFAGWWNFFTWLFGGASISAIMGNQLVTMWGLFHWDFAAQAWHVFVSYVIVTWIACVIVLFFNRALPTVEKVGMFIIVAGVFITIVVCAVMPHVNGNPYASNSFVWRDWENATGWNSNGFVFVAGMLNGAYAIGTPDIITHLAEEIPRPSVNVPKAILYQSIIGFTTPLLFLISLFYSTTSLEDVLNSSSSFPLTELYRQATGSAGGALGLLIITFLSSMTTCVGCYITAGRTFWALSRDKATPFAKYFSKINVRTHNPFNATLVCAVLNTLLACIYVGSVTAFNAFVGSFVIFSTASYAAAILPHLLSRRRNVAPGPFWMRGWIGFVVNAVSCLYILVFIVIFCFPFSRPVDAASMNYASLITGGLSLFVTAWWFVGGRKGYEGPRFISMENSRLVKDAV